MYHKLKITSIKQIQDGCWLYIALIYEFEFKENINLPNSPKFEHRVCIGSNIRQLDSLSNELMLLELSTKTSWITDKAMLTIMNMPDPICAEFSLVCNDEQQDMNNQTAYTTYTTSTEHNAYRFSTAASETTTKPTIQQKDIKKNAVTQHSVQTQTKANNQSNLAKQTIARQDSVVKKRRLSVEEKQEEVKQKL